MDAEEAAAAMDVAPERTAMVLPRDRLAGGRQEDERVEAGEVAVGERPLVLGLLDGEPPLAPEPANRGDSRGDRVVAKAGGLREDEDAEA